MRPIFCVCFFPFCSCFFAFLGREFPLQEFQEFYKNNPETLRKRVIWRTCRLMVIFYLTVGFHFCAFYYGDARFLMVFVPFWHLFQRH